MFIYKNIKDEHGRNALLVAEGLIVLGVVIKEKCGYTFTEYETNNTITCHDLMYLMEILELNYMKEGKK